MQPVISSLTRRQVANRIIPASSSPAPFSVNLHCPQRRVTIRPVNRRTFTASGKWRVATTEMSREQLEGLRVDRDRLMGDIHYSCQWGQGERWGDQPTETGMSRLSLSAADQHARHWFVDIVKSLGCTIKIDAMGNTFAVRPGRRDAPATFAGSHLDTQPTGGRYDGILGVCAGVEMLRVLEEKGVETEFPVGVINWTNEEGARFPISMVASGVWAGEVPLEKAHSLKEVGGGTKTMKEDLERIGYLGEMEASYEAMPLGAHFELHIEQGPILESTSKKIGAVQGVQAYRWHTITVHGRDTHTGTTSFPHRSDALLTASRLILHSHNLATKHGCLASTGILNLSPGSTNTVPGTVVFSLDIRCPEDETLRVCEEEMKRDFERITAGEDVAGLMQGGTKGKPCTVSWRLDMDSPATNFDNDCIRCVEDTAHALLGDAKTQEGEEMVLRMTSGAGHDSVYTSRWAPTSMIFVPCRDGVSHNPAEYCKPEDCANGAQVLLGAVLRYDRLRAERGAGNVS